MSTAARFQARLWLFAVMSLAGACDEPSRPLPANSAISDAAAPADAPAIPTGGTGGQGQGGSDAGTGGQTGGGTGGVPSDAALATDLSKYLDAPTLAEAGAPDVLPELDATGACASCYADGIASGACRNAKPGGCDEIPTEGVGSGKTPGDRALCQALDTCMKTSGCWASELGVPKCFCGDATNISCSTGAANGPCKAEIMAATRATTDAQAATLMYATTVPSGFAAQKYDCYRKTCLAVCK